MVFAFIGYANESIAKTVLEMKEHKVDDRELKLSVARLKTTRIFIGGLDKGETKDETVVIINIFLYFTGPLHNIHSQHTRTTSFSCVVFLL